MLWNSLRKLDYVKWWTIKKEIELSSICKFTYKFFFSIVVQSLSHVQFCVTPWTTACQASLSFTSSLSLLKLMFIESMMPSNHLILIRPLLLLPSIFPSIRVLSSELALCIGWPKYQSFSISPSSEYSGFNLLAVQGTLRVFSSTTIQKHQFFDAQPSLWSNSYWKTIALTTQNFVSKVIYLLLNTLSRFVIAFLPRSKHLLISCLQPPSTMILEPKKIKSVTVSTFSPSICHELMGLDAMILVFLMLSFKLAFSLSSFTPIKRKSYPSGNQNAIISANALYFILRTNDIYWLCLSKSILKIRFVFPKNF